jgi:hypothetical protein
MNVTDLLCRVRACPCPTAGSHEGCPYKIVLEDGEWFRFAQSVERIVWPTRTYPEPIDKEQQNRSGLSSHALCRAVIRGRDIRSACYAES